MFAIYKKELRSYFTGPVGYVFAGVYLALSALICCFTTLKSLSYDTRSFFSLMIMVMAVLVPLLTMRVFAEEKKQKTEQMLLTAPISLFGMVLGKFLAAFTVFASCAIVSCINLFPLYAIATEERAASDLPETIVGPVTGEIAGRLIGILLLGAAFIAIGIFISSLTENQLSAAVLSIVVIGSLLALALLTNYIPNYAIRAVIDWICLLSRYANFDYGLFDFSALLYYVSICGIFLFATVRVYDKRRWG